MARIKNNATGDVFEAPARDFANEADFTIVDSSTPITADAPVVSVSAAGEPDTAASAPVDPASSGSTSTPVAIPSSDQTSTPTSDSSPSSSEPTSTPAGTAPSVQGDAGNVTGSNALPSSPETSNGTVSSSDSSLPLNSGSANSNVESATPSTDTASNSGSLSSSASTGEQGNVAVSTSPVVDATGAVSGDTGNAPVGAVASATDAATPSAADPTPAPVVAPAPTLDAEGKHIVSDQLEADMLFAVAQLVTPTDSIKHAADAFFGAVRSQIDVEAV
ncbi:MAG: hypothetical protein VB138_05820 [Burkholderia sp.]